MRAQHGVQFASEVGGKAHDAAVLDRRPFRVRSGQDVNAVRAKRGGKVFGINGGNDFGRERADDLGFLAAHHVRQAPGRRAGKVARNAGHDPHRPAMRRLDRNGLCRQRRRIGRARHIRRLAPALGAADHAAGEQRQFRLVLEPISGQLRQRGRVAARAGLGEVLDAMCRFAFGDHLTGAHQERAQTARPPVEGQQVRKRQ